jgi:hypothetical protein
MTVSVHSWALGHVCAWVVVGEVHCASFLN